MMKRTLLFLGCTILVSVFCLSCASLTPTASVDGFHEGVNTGSVEQAMMYVAEEAVFTINAAPIAGANGVFVGQTEIEGWLNGVVESGGKAKVYGMDLAGNQLNCLLSYEDDFLANLGFGSLQMEEISILSNGQIQSYALSWLPSEELRFENALSTSPIDLFRLNPADRKFFMPGYISQSESALPWLHDVDPADRKFFNEGYIWSR